MIEPINDEIPVGALDKSDPRDYRADFILGDEHVEIPDVISLRFSEGNQGAKEATRVACTHYSCAHAMQYPNEQEHKKRIIPDFELGWELQKEFGTYSSKGDYVQTALKSIKKNGLHDLSKDIYLAEGYARIERNEIDYWLARGFVIVTSSITTDSNFKKAKHEGIWGGIEGAIKGGHAFVIAGKEPGFKVASNSYGPSWGFYGDGTFKIRDEDVQHLRSCYLIYDKIDMEYIFKDVVDNGSEASNAIKWAKEAGILKGYQDGRFGPNDPLTRGQFAIIKHREFESSKE